MNTKWYYVPVGVIILLFAIGIGSIEAWRHGTIHFFSGMLILVMVVTAIGLIAGQMQQTSILDGLSNAAVKIINAWKWGDRRDAETRDRRSVDLDEDQGTEIK